MGQALTVGKVAKQAAVNVETLRYYERRGLLAPAGYRESGYRLYTPETVQRIRFIKNAQELGFSLKEITELLRLSESHKARCGSVKRHAREKLADVEGKIKWLEDIRDFLRHLTRICVSRRPTDQCPILHGLEDGIKGSRYGPKNVRFRR